MVWPGVYEAVVNRPGVVSALSTSSSSSRSRESNSCPHFGRCGDRVESRQLLLDFTFVGLLAHECDRLVRSMAKKSVLTTGSPDR